MGITVEYYDEIDRSTNLRAAELAAAGAEEWSYVLADIQRGGRGRRGREWVSAGAGENIALSVILRPRISPDRVSMLTLLAALAARDAIGAETGLSPLIKWPNDILLQEKKAAGILTELFMQDGAVAYCVLGIGINVGQRAFAGELRERATSLYLAAGRSFDRRQLAERFLAEMKKRYLHFLEEQRLESVRTEYQDALISMNRPVRILPEDTAGICRGISGGGALLLETPAGLREITAGEVSVRGIGGYI